MPGIPAPVRHSSTPVLQRLRANSHDVSSLEDGENCSTPVRRKDTARKRKPLLPLGDVIEISSDDDCPPAPSVSSRIVTDLRRQVKKLKEVIQVNSFQGSPFNNTDDWLSLGKFTE